MRVGIIGYGSMGRMLLEKLSKIDWDSIPDEVPEPGTRFDMKI